MGNSTAGDERRGIQCKRSREGEDRLLRFGGSNGGNGPAWVPDSRGSAKGAANVREEAQTDSNARPKHSWLSILTSCNGDFYRSSRLWIFRLWLRTSTLRCLTTRQRLCLVSDHLVLFGLGLCLRFKIKMGLPWGPPKDRTTEKIR